MGLVCTQCQSQQRHCHWDLQEGLPPPGLGKKGEERGGDASPELWCLWSWKQARPGGQAKCQVLSSGSPCPSRC